MDCGGDDSALRDSRALHGRLDARGVRQTYAEDPRGHDSGYWRVHLVESLEAVAKGMR